MSTDWKDWKYGVNWFPSSDDLSALFPKLGNVFGEAKSPLTPL